jgi:hypothetical protein
MEFQPPCLKPRPVHPSSRPKPQPARPLERPSRSGFDADAAHRVVMLSAVLLVVSLGSCTVAPLLGALQGSIKPAAQKVAMVA